MATRTARYSCEGGYDPHEPHCSEAYTCSELHAKDLLDPNNIYYPKVLQQKEHPRAYAARL